MLKSCPEKQKLLEVASTEKSCANTKSCSKVAGHNLDMPTHSAGPKYVKNVGVITNQGHEFELAQQLLPFLCGHT